MLKISQVFMSLCVPFYWRSHFLVRVFAFFSHFFVLSILWYISMHVVFSELSGGLHDEVEGQKRSEFCTRLSDTMVIHVTVRDMGSTPDPVNNFYSILTVLIPVLRIKLKSRNKKKGHLPIFPIFYSHLYYVGISVLYFFQAVSEIHSENNNKKYDTILWVSC